MFLSDGEIREMMKSGGLHVSPLSEQQIQPASIDIRLGTTFSMLEHDPRGVIDPAEKMEYKTIETNEFVLLPQQFVLATTAECIKLPDNLIAFVEGRSSWGRVGLFIQNAGWIDPGFEGEITLELYNANRLAIKLTPGLRIGQLVFARMGKNALSPYRGKYQNQRTATGSRVFLDDEMLKAVGKKGNHG